jgi:hypothetical protein
MAFGLFKDLAPRRHPESVPGTAGEVSLVGVLLLQRPATEVQEQSRGFGADNSLSAQKWVKAGQRDAGSSLRKPTQDYRTLDEDPAPLTLYSSH